MWESATVDGEVSMECSGWDEHYIGKNYESRW